MTTTIQCLALELVHFDTCTSDYFRGTTRPHLQVVAWKNMQLEELKSSLRSELNQYIGGHPSEIEGAQGDSKYEWSDSFYTQAKKAIAELSLIDGHDDCLFTDLDDVGEDDDYPVYAYFAFVPLD